jgi:hypothetical protein
MKALEGDAPSYGFVFASPRHPLAAALIAVAEASGCEDLIGFTSAGEIGGDALVHGGVSVMLVHAPSTAHRIAFATGMTDERGGAARRLYREFGNQSAQAKTLGWAQSSSVIAMDGLSSGCERLVKDIMAEAGPFQQLVGGAAGVDPSVPGPERAQVGAGREAASDAAVALHVFGRTRWGIGVEHGLEAPKPTAAGVARMMVTRTSGQTIEELDGRPAVEAYQRNSRALAVEFDPESPRRCFARNPLGLYFLDELRLVRVPLGVTPGGGLVCPAEIPQGSTVSILQAEPEGMVRAAGRAAATALKNLEGGRPAGILLFDCDCRAQALGSGFERELTSIRAVFPGTPIAGLLTYGEIARFRGRLEGWHHSTAVVVAIPQ